MTQPGSFGSVNVPSQYQSRILMAAARWNISSAVLAAQLQAESDFNPNAISGAGAVGIAQFLPSTAKAYGIDPYNVDEAIDGMAMLDAKYRAQFGSIDKALAAYNAGPGAVSHYGGVPPYAETQNYVKKILAAAGSAANEAGSAVLTGLSLPDPLPELTGFFGTVTSGLFWRRIGVGALGLLIVVVGMYFMMEKQGGGYAVARKITENIK